MIKTQRLVLRQWQKEDEEPFVCMNADPRVMEFFPDLKTRHESDAMIKRLSNHIARCGWGFWAVSLLETNQFIGFIGLEEVSFKTDFTPAVEIGWRLSYDFWGRGYATEGALASLQYGFQVLKLDTIVSFTAVQNLRSRAVMERIGMHYKSEFEHPKLPEGHPLRKHVLYEIKKSFYILPTLER